MTYIVTEPAPSTTNYVRSGRGGAGNIRTKSSNITSSTTLLSSHSTHSKPQPGSTRRFFSGIGGAGNAHSASERPTISLDNEFRRAAARDQTNVGHCGIGGAGNVFHRRASSVKTEGDESDGSSASGAGSFTGKFWGKVNHAFSKD